MNDNYNFFCDRVCSYIDHATEKEKRAIHKELSDHIEDHAQALIELGRDETEARVAAIVAMGDPEEIGRELNKEYPLVWLIVSRAALALAIVLALTLIDPIATHLGNARGSIQYRIAPMSQPGSEYLNEIDYRIEIPDSNDVIRFYACDIAYDAKRGQYYAEIATVSYDRNPFGEVSSYMNSIEYYVGGEKVYSLGGGGYQSHYLTDFSDKVPLEYGQDSVTAVYDHYGNYFSVEIPLNWEGIA